MIFYASVLTCIVSFFPLIFTLTIDVYFKEVSCDTSYVINSDTEIYKVIWSGETYPKFCELRFKTLHTDTYNLCATVTKFNLQCGSNRALYFSWSWGVMTNFKRYDCHASLPISYCNKNDLNVGLEPRFQNIHSSNSMITIMIQAKHLSTQSFDTSPDTSVVGAVFGTLIGLTVFIVAVTCCVISCRTQLKPATQLPEAVINNDNNARVTTACRSQQLCLQTGNFNPSYQMRPIIQYPGATSTECIQDNKFEIRPRYSGHSSNPNNTGVIESSAPLLDPNFEQTLDSSLAPPPSYSEVMKRRSDYGL